MDICHLTFTAARRSRLPLFPDQHYYLEALHRLGAIASGCLALFAIIAEHLHLVALLSRLAAGRFAQLMILTLRPVVTTPLAPSFPTMVESRSHMRWLLRYLLEQPKQHGMPGHPALWVGSCFPDLVGARQVSGLSLCIDRALPDYSDAAALRILGLPGTEVPPAHREMLRAAGCERLKQAAAAAFAVDETLRGNRPATVLARRATAQLAARVGLPLRDVSRAMSERSPNTAYRLTRPDVGMRALMTVARRVGLENLVRDSMFGGRHGQSHPGLRPDIDDVSRRSA